MQDPRVSDLERFYSLQSVAIVTQRTDAVAKLQQRELSIEQYTHDLNCINEYYDKQQEHLALRVSRSLQLLKSMFPSNVKPPGGQTRKQKSRLLNPKAVELMSDWYQKHESHPYPNDDEKRDMAEGGNISLAQVKAWFANKRNRTLNTKPKRQKAHYQKQIQKACDVYTDGKKTSFVNMMSDLSDLIDINQLPTSNVGSALTTLVNLTVMS